jgi:hypothetical protein
VRRHGDRGFQALANASWDVVYLMSLDWSELRALDGRGFSADTESPSTSWLEKYIDRADQPEVLEAIQRAIRNRTVFELEHRVRRPSLQRGPGRGVWNSLARSLPRVAIAARRRRERPLRLGHRGTCRRHARVHLLPGQPGLRPTGEGQLNPQAAARPSPVGAIAQGEGVNAGVQTPPLGYLQSHARTR